MTLDTQWVDKPSTFGPYDGCLVVMNMGKDNYQAFEFPRDYEEEVVAAIGRAHADGWTVIHLFYHASSLSECADNFEFMEEVDHLRGANMYGSNLDFSLDPVQRLREMNSIMDGIWADEGFKFFGNRSAMIGQCKIAGTEALIPFTEIDAPV